MSGKIKVALCLSGEPRHSMFCFSYIYESFIDIGEEFNVDVFTHHRKTFRAKNLYNPKNTLYEPFSDQDLFNLIDSLSLPQELLDYHQFYDSYTNKTNLIINPIKMFDSIFKSINLALNFESYDIIIRSRYDFITSYKLNIASIIKDILDNKYNLFIPKKPPKWQSPIEYSDQLAIGDLKSMEHYSNLLSNLPNIINIVKEWRSEKWLYEYINNSSIKVNQHYLDLNLVRDVLVSSNKGTPDISYYDI